jgi:hypothetical protein
MSVSAANSSREKVWSIGGHLVPFAMICIAVVFVTVSMKFDDRTGMSNPVVEAPFP